MTASKQTKLIDDDHSISTNELSRLEHAALLDLHSVISILSSPDTKLPVTLLGGKTAVCVSDGNLEYPLKNGSPVLYPIALLNSGFGEQISIEQATSSLTQYFLLSQIKQSGEINASTDSRPYEKHLYRMWRFCEGLNGITLDVGCDSPKVSASIYPANCSYIGLDPFSLNQEFRIVGTGEFLPFADQSVDNVIFNTSLDHILDHHTAIEEAYRVLKPGGVIVISTFAWLDRATLLTDSVHFHHFREYEIMGALSAYDLSSVERYVSPKEENHRYGLYVRANKPMIVDRNKI